MLRRSRGVLDRSGEGERGLEAEPSHPPLDRENMHYQELYSLVQAPLVWLRGALRHEPFKAIVLRGTRTATPSGTKRSDGEVQVQQTRENPPEPDVVLAVALTRAD
jgi:hypothetical protein